MSRTFAGFVLLLIAALALLLPGKAVAGPPEGASRKMVLDEVEDGLRRYRMEKDEEKKGDWLVRLAKTRDVRVAVLLGEQHDLWYAAHKANKPEPALGYMAHSFLYVFFVPDELIAAEQIDAWWKANEADLRRRAAQLPR